MNYSDHIHTRPTQVSVSFTTRNGFVSLRQMWRAYDSAGDWIGHYDSEQDALGAMLASRLGQR